jgi:hypothetical protein
MKLVQKQLFKGSREFEIIDATINSRIKTLRKEEKLTVDLAMINPEPEVNGPFLDFHSRVKCAPLLSLWLDKPNTKEFNAFVDALKQRARQEYNAFAGFSTGTGPDRLPGNVYDEPPEFGEPDKNRARTKVIPLRVDETIQMLRQHLDGDEIETLVTALEALKADPENAASFDQLLKAFDDLGPRQGAVLTYAPYVSLLLSDDPFGF